MSGWQWGSADVGLRSLEAWASELGRLAPGFALAWTAEAAVTTWAVMGVYEGLNDLPGGNGTSHNFADLNCATSFARRDGNSTRPHARPWGKPGAKS